MNKAKKKLKIIVCGTRFGQFYTEAIKQSGEFEFAGILSQGSAKSQKLAQAHGVKIYTDPAQLPPDIDLACVVIRTGVLGGDGTQIAIRLMEKGIHVLLEQPVHQKDLALCYKTARQNKVFFVLGDLYVELPSVKTFITLSQGVIKHQFPLYMNIDLSTLVSFPLVHILAKALPTLRPWKVEQTIKGDIPFQVISMTIGKIPVVIRAHNQVDTRISDSYLHLMHRISLGVGGGCLSLVDTHGPVIWQPRMIFPDHDDFILEELSERPSVEMLDESTRIIGPPQYPTYQEVLTRIWPGAIVKDIKRLAGLACGITPESQMAQFGQQEMLCSQLWREISNALGYPNSYENPDREYLPAAAVVGFYFQQIGMAETYNQLSKEEIDACISQLDQACLWAMLFQFQKNGVLGDPEKCYAEEALISALPVISRHYYVIRRWLKVLTDRGYLVSEKNGFRSAGKTITQEKLDRQWQKVRALWDHRLGSPLVSLYFQQNVQALPALMSGEQQAVLILFPEGSTDVANALYRETLIAWYLNRQVAAEVEKIVLNTSGKLRILEVGAGTGATSDVVIDRIKSAQLSGRIDNYLYTDISPNFLGAAKVRYQDEPWVTLQVIDLEKDFQAQGQEKETKDIIIAAGVLNNVNDIVRVLENLKALLAPGGIMLLTEVDGESVEILISQIFMMDAANDARKESDTTFMNHGQWQKAFAQVNLKLLKMIPGNDHKLSHLGQKLFMLTKG
ncbi:bifunctional Gfo/Idh/MocA family oxidoreductase/class I SAM-dependent methyltransferase [Desulfobacter vibrioformis]|uniref:bifunctional Gfo/Idh/MocA family oxidoreductase/class I SAM-dependent methyltransferase n=1 Tax=Desulfobacter vibrioformis TaxID=34031 RepID=UPI000551D560|nr:bifunctional Gfo/Idh/MocA family oxidoreductase/class I SAM-dependent methyltransferase [Desulfobacter vibrioformis]